VSDTKLTTAVETAGGEFQPTPGSYLVQVRIRGPGRHQFVAHKTPELVQA